ncbi:DUF58 domain-containing protein [Labedaea rhizosphaerae]|uniref:Uncharacterized protein (DUF58 family) n=1 Tax=Labedaea rhizosphaerae TaxID=598644 RepID=A0A4R6SBC2_LABRH|nr:DUF58 domain-containing protein [Labedaea rhizosphaerae]TDP97232.1 uncharacterized protein (DUF58 family) [Labedaea rhizosphaerae]
MRGALSGLTTRGRCLLAAGIAAALCSFVLNERDLLRVAVFVIALPVLVAWVTSASRVRLLAQRQILPPRVAVGARAEVALTVQSAGRLPTGGLLLQDGVPYALGGKPRFVVEHLPRHGGVQLRYPLQPALRGIHQVGPLRVTVTDPFGLTEFDKELAGVTRMVVVPKVYPLTGVPGGSGLGSGEDGSVRLHNGQGEDDAIVRQYRQGDDLRKVHWRSTARHDEMMVRVEERPWRGGTTVMLDHRANAHRGSGVTASLEWAVSFAASACLHLHRHGHRIRLVTESGASLTSEVSEGMHSEHVVLDALAALQSTQRRELSCTFDPAHGQELVAVLGVTTPEDLGEMIRHRPRSARSLAVLLDPRGWGDTNPAHHPDRSATLLRGAGWGVMVARPDTPMNTIWSALCHTTSQHSGAMIAGMP